MRLLLIGCLVNALLLTGANAEEKTEEKKMTLGQQLEATAQKYAERSPAAIQQKFKQGIDAVEALGLTQSAKQVGDEAVDAELMAWDESKVKLSDLWKEGPLVITWYRGGWCPYCNLQLRAMQESLAKLEGAGAKFVAITPELPENAKETAEANEQSFITLHDANNDLARKYGIVFELPEVIVPIYRDRLKLGERNGTDKLELPLAATYVIDKSGKIRWAFLHSDYKKRAEPIDVIEAVKSLQE